MIRRTILILAALICCFGFAVPSQESRQDEGAKKIEALTRALEAEKKHSADLEKRIDRIEAWFASVRVACEGLDEAANSARKNGFESAGPNPAAKTNVLDGMKKFAADLVKSAPAAK